MHKTTVLMLSLITAVALVMLPACGAKPSQKIAETAAAKAAEIASGGKAKVDIGSNVDLSGLPANLRYPGAKGLASWTANQDSTKGTYYTLESSDPAAGVKDFFTKSLAGWKQSMTMNNADGSSMMTYSSTDNKQTAVITIAPNKDKGTTTISIIYATK